ncbi:MAG: class I SAM-dependent methyltransferase [Deltaproteobacteria bacterium]|nr:class I SAM-dependent methyltransferase [Deltaproteobacteria bacterium]
MSTDPRLSPLIKDYFRRDDAAAVWWNVDNLPRYRAQVRLFTQTVPLAGKRVLDLGVGKGRFSIAAAQAGAASVRAVDISAKMIEEAEAKARSAGVEDRISFEVGDAEEFESEDRYHAIVLMEVLVHLPEAEKVVQKCANMLEPGGYLLTNIDLPDSVTGPHDKIHSLAKRTYNLLPRLVRRQLHRRLGWPERVQPKQRAATTAETLEILERDPNAVMSRADDAFRGIDKQAFLGWLRGAGLEVVKVDKERQFLLEVGYVAVARRPGS